MRAIKRVYCCCCCTALCIGPAHNGLSTRWAFLAPKLRLVCVGRRAARASRVTPASALNVNPAPGATAVVIAGQHRAVAVMFYSLIGFILPATFQ